MVTFFLKGLQTTKIFCCFRNLNNQQNSSKPLSNNSLYSNTSQWSPLEQQQQFNNQNNSFSRDFNESFQQKQFSQQQNYYGQQQQQNNTNFQQMFPQQLLNEPMLNTANFAAHVGGQFAEQQKEKVVFFD